MRELGINERDLNTRMDELVSKAMMDSEIAFNPVIAGEEDLRKIFMDAF